METASSCSSPRASSSEDCIAERVSINDSLNSFYFGYKSKHATMVNAPSDNTVSASMSNGFCAAASCSAVDTFQESMPLRKSTDKWVSRKSNTEILRRQDAAVPDSSKETSGSRSTNLTSSNNISNMHVNGHTTSAVHETKYSRQHGNLFESRSKHGSSSLLYAGKNGTNVHESGTDFILSGGNSSNVENTFNDETVELKSFYETTVMNGSVKANSALHPMGTKISKSSRSRMKVSGEQSYSEVEGRGQIANVSGRFDG